MRGTLMKLIDDFERWKANIQNTHHSALAASILDESGYNEMWKLDKAPDAPGRLENLKELVSAMEEFESLQEFLEHIALVLENQNSNNNDAITLMTLHAAKGLEFKTTFLPGWEEGLFPSQRSMDENGVKGLEEERRLAYVAITRARQKCHVSFVSNRRMYGSWVNAIPSRFVDELPEENIEQATELGMVQPGRSNHWDSSGVNQSPPRYQSRDAKTVDGVHSNGDRVFHEKFGMGTIIHIDGGKLDIAFDNAGQKRVMDSFVEKTG